MKRRSILLVAVAVLMVTSGCLGGVFGGQDTPNDTNGPVGEEPNTTEGTADTNTTETPTNSTETPGESNESWIVAQHPGMSKSSVDPATVVEYHNAQTVRDGSYYVQQETIYQTGSEQQKSDTRVIVEPTNDKAFWVERTTEEKRSYFASPEYNGTFVKIDSNNETSYYHTSELISITKYTHGEVLENILRSGDYKPTETYQEEGSELVRLTTTTPNENHLGQDVDQYQGFVLVDDEGRIRAAGHHLTWSENGVEKSLTVRITYENFGEVTVDDPDWLGTAVDESDYNESSSSSSDE